MNMPATATPPSPPAALHAPARHPEPHISRLIAFYEALAPADLDRLDEVYAPRAVFKDPFNEVAGVGAIRSIFVHMFQALEAPRFEVRQVLGGGSDCALTWRFHFGLRGRAMHIDGASWLHFAPDGRVDRHRDYWDAAEELYAKLPLLGALMRWLRRRLAAPQPDAGPGA